MSVTGFFNIFPNNKWVLHIGNKIKYILYDLNGVGSIKNLQKLKPQKICQKHHILVVTSKCLFFFKTS